MALDQPVQQELNTITVLLLFPTVQIGFLASKENDDRTEKHGSSYFLFSQQILSQSFGMGTELLNGCACLWSDVRVIVRHRLDQVLSFLQFDLQITVALQFLIGGQRLFADGFIGSLDLIERLFVECVLLGELMELKVSLLTRSETLFEIGPVTCQFFEKSVNVVQLGEAEYPCQRARTRIVRTYLLNAHGCLRCLSQSIQPSSQSL